MDFALESDEGIRAELRAYLDASLPESMRNVGFDWAFDRDFHIAFTEWQRTHLAGASDSTLAAFTDELFWAHLDLRTVGTTGLVSRILSVVGTDEQKRDLLPLLLRGEKLVALGYTEPEAGSDVAAAATRAIHDGDEWVITGQKMFTSNADICDYVFLLTRSNTSAPKHEGLTMFLVPLDAPGVEIRPVQTLRGHPTFMTYYTEVRVPDSARVGDVDAGWSVMRVSLDAEHGAGTKIDLDTRLGGSAGGYGNWLRHVRDRSVVWARAHRDESGSRVIDRPEVRRELARMAIDLEICRVLDGRNDADADKPGVGNARKLFASEAYLRATHELLEMAGADGLLDVGSEESPAEGWIEYAFRDAPVATIAGGASEVQRDVIAERRLGLPSLRRAGGRSR